MIFLARSMQVSLFVIICVTIAIQAMRDIVAKCLTKDPTKRPSAAQLLEHKFFKTAHEPSYLVKNLLAGLPPVAERVKLMRAGKGQQPVAEQHHADAQSQVHSSGHHSLMKRILLHFI